jgi:hypothetical protein
MHDCDRCRPEGNRQSTVARAGLDWASMRSCLGSRAAFWRAMMSPRVRCIRDGAKGAGREACRPSCPPCLAPGARASPLAACASVACAAERARPALPPTDGRAPPGRPERMAGQRAVVPDGRGPGAARGLEGCAFLGRAHLQSMRAAHHANRGTPPTGLALSHRGLVLRADPGHDGGTSACDSRRSPV